MGALAHVKVHYTELEDYLKAQAARQIPLFGTFLDGENMYTKELSANGIIVMGNEGNGIRPQIEKLINQKTLYSKLSTRKRNIRVFECSHRYSCHLRRISPLPGECRPITAHKQANPLQQYLQNLDVPRHLPTVLPATSAKTRLFPHLTRNYKGCVRIRILMTPLVLLRPCVKRGNSTRIKMPS